MKTRLTDLLDIEYPLIQAPMAGVSTPEMAAAVAQAGALGSISVGTLTAEKADAAMAGLAAMTNRPFNVNVFTHQTPERDDAKEQSWLNSLKPYFDGFDTTPPPALGEIYKSFNDDPDMLEALVSRRPGAVSFHFGLPKKYAVDALKNAGVVTLCTATTVAEARAVEACGIDVVVAQGQEAGGHSGCFDPDDGAEPLGLMALLPQVVEAVGIPVVAAGGIANGAGIAAALVMGAAGAQLGTAFVSSLESAAPPAHHEAITGTPGHATVVTRAVSGRPARGIANRLTREMAGRDTEVPAYPVAYDAGKAVSAAAKSAGNRDFSVFWAGQAGPLNRRMPAGDLVDRLIGEAKSALKHAADGALTAA